MVIKLLEQHYYNGKIEALGAIYTIISAKDLNPAGITLVYEVHGRE